MKTEASPCPDCVILSAAVFQAERRISRSQSWRVRRDPSSRWRKRGASGWRISNPDRWILFADWNPRAPETL